MANFDRFSAIVVSQYGGGTYNNIVHGQITDEGVEGTALTGFAEVVNDNFVAELKKTVVDSMQYVAIVVRRLKPAVTDVEVKAISVAGDLPQSGLPGTVYTLLRYFCTPYEAGSAYNWKLNGLPDDANVRGLMTVQAVTRMTTLIEKVTLSPYISEGNTYQFTRQPKSTDAPGVALPRIYKAQTDNTLRNLRSRQVRVA